MSENPIFSYTRRDYEGSRREGLSKIPILSKGQWTDLNATDPGVIILDYVHAIVDMMNFYQDHQACEAFITTAKERANIFRLAKQLSYKVRSAKGATCEVTFTSYFTYDHPILIPKYTVVSTNSDITYLTMEDAHLRAGTTTVTVPCTQGTLAELVYKGTGISRFSSVLGATNQSVTINTPNIDVDSIVVTDNLGRVWTPVDYIVFSNPRDRSYQVDLNYDDSVTIKFGDGERGVVPSDTDTLTIQYIVTKAEEGRVGANSIINLERIITDSGNYIEFTVNNNHASVGGSSSQSSMEIREEAPGIIKSQDRAVTLADFENIAKRVPGVADAIAHDINTDPDLDYHTVRVLIVPDDSAIVSTESGEGSDSELEASLRLLKDNVVDYISNRMIPPTNLQVATPAYMYIDITIKIKSVPSIVEGGLEYDIHSKVREYFKSRAGSIGETFYPNELIPLVSNIQGVRYVAEITPSAPIEVDQSSIVALRTLRVELL